MSLIFSYKYRYSVQVERFHGLVNFFLKSRDRR